MLIEAEGSWALQASVYLHLNPVRIKGLGLGKRERKAELLGILPPPSPELVKARLDAWRRQRWSSYLDYAGYRPKPPEWLTCDAFCNRRGDWGRDVALCLGRRHCGLTLQELGQAAGGMRLETVAMAVRRIERQLVQDRSLAQQVRRMEKNNVQ